MLFKNSEIQISKIALSLLSSKSQAQKFRFKASNKEEEIIQGKNVLNISKLDFQFVKFL